MTIWNSDETFNKKEMGRYITWLLDQGAQSLSFCGSTGENIAMTMDEQKENSGILHQICRRTGSRLCRHRKIFDETDD